MLKYFGFPDYSTDFLFWITSLSKKNYNLENQSGNPVKIPNCLSDQQSWSTISFFIDIELCTRSLYKYMENPFDLQDPPTQGHLTWLYPGTEMGHFLHCYSNMITHLAGLFIQCNAVKGALNTTQTNWFCRRIPYLLENRRICLFLNRGL